MKKKIIALSVALVLVAVAAIGATLSFLTDTQDIKNVYQIGDIDVTAIEIVKHTSGDGKVIDAEESIELLEASQGDHLYDNIQPGDEMKKVIHVENESETNAAYIAVAVKMGNHYTFNQKIDDYYEAKEGYGKDTAATEALFDSIFTGHDLTYIKDATTNTFRLYPSATRVDQDGSENYNMMAPADLPTTATLLAVDAVKASSNNGAANGYGAYANNMFKVGDTGVTADTTFNDVPDFYAVKNDVANGEYKGERLWVYYYYVPAGESFNLDLSIACPDVIDNYSLDAFQDMYLNVQVSAIQVTGFNSAKDAFLELNNTYPYNVY